MFQLLNNSNYFTWKFKMEMHLVQLELWSVIEEPIPQVETEVFRRKNQKACATIAMCVENSQIHFIRGIKCAKEMWIKLQKVHERKTMTSKLHLLRKLYDKRMSDGENMQHHLDCLNVMRAQLLDRGEDIKDSSMVAIILNSLPKTYSSLVTSIEGQPEQTISLEYVMEKLLDESERRSDGNDEEGEKNSALKGQQYKKKRPLKCFHCHKLGHVKKDCFKWKKQNAAVSECGRVDDEICLQVANGIGWVIDSGASIHMTSNRNFFNNLEKSSGKVFIADGRSLDAIGIGNGFINGKYNKIHLRNVLYVPDLNGSLLSVKEIVKKGLLIEFKESKCFILNKNKVVAEGILKENLYILCEATNNETYISQSCFGCVHLWHRRLGHRNITDIKKLEQLGAGICIEKCNDNDFCDTCAKSKLTRTPFPKASLDRSKEILNIIHSDVCGPFQVKSRSGKRYFLSFIDDYSRYSKVYVLSTKNEVFSKFKEFHKEVENFTNKKLKILRCDNGGEYINDELKSYLKMFGIILQTTVPYCPEQNGIAERKNRTLVEMVRAMLSGANLSKSLWAECVMAANYIQNRLPSKSLDKTPFELWYNKKPNLSHMRVYGCKVFVQIPKCKRQKLDDASVEGTLVGYGENVKGYRILINGSNKIIVSKDVKFEERFSFTQEIKCDLDDSSIPNDISKDKGNEICNNEVPSSIKQIQGEKQQSNPEGLLERLQDEESSEQVQLRRSDRLKDKATKNWSEQINELFLVKTLETVVSDNAPVSWNEMIKMKNPERELWLQSANDEYESLVKNKTWVLTQLPNGKKVIGCKWVFQLKNTNVNKPKYKSRLVAKGYTQSFGEDYDETFAPVGKFVTLRTVLAVSAVRKYIVKHLDVKSAFLNGNIQEEIYMEQPQGFIQKGNEQLVCRLQKSIYGLKQAAKSWYDTLNEVLDKIGFIRSKADNCLYIKQIDQNFVYILIYVDDILICSKYEDEISNIYKELNDYFEIKDLGLVSSYLGIQIERNSKGDFLLHQEDKIKRLIVEAELEDAKPSYIPMDPEFVKITHEENLLPNNIKFRSVMGILLHISITTRPDIAVAVSILCRRVDNPRKCDLEAAKKVIRYLKTTINSKLILRRNSDLSIRCFTDANWAGEGDRKSTSGYLFLLGCNSISWSSKKQSTIALSSTEAEFIAASYAGQELLWLLQLMSDMNICVTKPIPMYEDNQSCIKIINSSKFSARTKHIDVKFHHIKNLQNDGIIDLKYCPSKQQFADFLTKPLSFPTFKNFITRILC